VGGVTEGDIEVWEILHDLLSIIFWIVVEVQKGEVGVSVVKIQGILDMFSRRYHLSTDSHHPSIITHSCASRECSCSRR
jgi:hypothetical protein